MPSLRSNKVKQHEEASRHHSKELATLKKEWDDLPTALLFEELEVNPWPVDGLILVLQHDSAVNLPPLPSQRSTPVTSPGRHATPRLPRETPEHTPERVKDEPDERMGSDDEEHGMVQGEERMDCRALGKAVLMDLTEEELAGVEKALVRTDAVYFGGLLSFCSLGLLVISRRSSRPCSPSRKRYRRCNPTLGLLKTIRRRLPTTRGRRTSSTR